MSFFSLPPCTRLGVGYKESSTVASSSGAVSPHGSGCDLLHALTYGVCVHGCIFTEPVVYTLTHLCVKR